MASISSCKEHVSIIGTEMIADVAQTTSWMKIWDVTLDKRAKETTALFHDISIICVSIVR